MLTASVIIPTYNRPDQLTTVLEALAKQNFPSDCTEVLIIDDGSKVPYDSVIQKDWPFHVRYLRQENAGEVAARINGIEHASSDFFIFLDDDIYVDPPYIAELMREHERYPNSVLIGVLYPYLSPASTPFERAIANPPTNILPGEVSFIECGTGTMSVGRSVYDKAGGMRTLGPGGRNAWGGMDFAYRASLAGATVRRVVGATAYHDDYALKDLATMSRRFFNVSKMAVLHFQRYPELIAQIPMFRDKAPIRWGKDRVDVILRKFVRAIINAKPALALMQGIARALARRSPSHPLLRKLYRWIVRGNIYQGYREGLRAYGKVRS